MKTFNPPITEIRAAGVSSAREKGPQDRPTVSIVVPCRNERNYIEACVRSLLSQERPKNDFELLVVDGMSDDGTREILEQLASADGRLKIIDNPRRNTPSAMNAGIRHARGEYVAILGAHASYAPDYIRVCAEMLETQPDIWCSGGPVVSRASTAFGAAVALAMSHPVGVGNARHRFPDYEGDAEGACFPVFRREAFDRVGLYDETLVRNQDDEFNLRVAKSGGRIFISPRARCEYFVRESPAGLFRQYFQYGYWRVAVLRKHLIPASLRQMAPVTLFVVMLLGIVAGGWLGGYAGLIVAAALPLVYLGLLTASAMAVASKSQFLSGLFFPVAAGIMHFAYAAGFAWALVARPDGRKLPRK